MKKILNFQKCHLLSKCLESARNQTLREIGNTAKISSGLELRQGLLYCVLQPMCYNLADMHQLTPNIHEVIAFSKWLIVKQNLRSGLKSVLYSHIWTLGTNISLAPNFM
jgi:hypothetical protein